MHSAGITYLNITFQHSSASASRTTPFRSCVRDDCDLSSVSKAESNQFRSNPVKTSTVISQGLCRKSLGVTAAQGGEKQEPIDKGPDDYKTFYKRKDKR